MHSGGLARCKLGNFPVGICRSVKIMAPPYSHQAATLLEQSNCGFPEGSWQCLPQYLFQEKITSFADIVCQPYPTTIRIIFR